MTDISITAPVEAEQVPATDENAPFYVVSTRKLTILFIATMGAYALYWFYKNWNQYRNRGAALDEAHESIWPIPRAIFLVFFVHSLFRKVKSLGQDKPQVAAWRNDGHAWWMVLLYVAMNVADQLSKRSIGIPMTDYFGFVGLVLLLLSFRKAQSMINASCNDPEGKLNAGLTGANYVWIVIGVLVWVGAFMAGFMGGATDGYSAAGGHGF